MVESQPSKLLVAGSIPVSRSIRRRIAAKADSLRSRPLRLGRPCEGGLVGVNRADVAQLAERVLGKDEVTSSILVIGSSLRSRELPPKRELRLGKRADFAKAVSPKRRGRAGGQQQLNVIT